MFYLRACRRGLNVFGWLLKYLISASKVPVNEVFAALINETLQQKSPLAPADGSGSSGRTHSSKFTKSLTLYQHFCYFLTLNRYIIIVE